MTIQKIITYWRTSAERNWKTAQGLFKLKRYDACLFFCHLALEKLLKGLVAQITHKPVPFIHDLAKLAAFAKLTLTPEQVAHLRTITTFNIAARYDNIKLAFYKQCTPAYTKKYYNKTKELLIWLGKNYH